MIFYIGFHSDTNISTYIGIREDNNKMDIQEVGWEDVDWIEMAQDRDRWQAVANVALNLRFP
jgi:hypothetical protein